MSTPELIEISPDDDLFTDFATVFQRAGEADWGKHHSAYPASELAMEWTRESHETHGWALTDNRTVVGALYIDLPVLDNNHMAFGEVAVLPDVTEADHYLWMMLDQAEAFVRAAGRNTLLIESQTPTGRADALAAVLEARGFSAAQKCARNGQPLPVSTEVAQQMRAVIDLDDGYRIETSVDGLPDEWLSERARLGAMMSTDTPLGELEIQPEVWDENRVRDMFRVDAERGRRVIEAVAWHEASGQMAAFTHVSVPQETPWVAYQDDTLVEKAHRGHRLGYRVKAAVALLLPEIAPDVEAQRTWNDETNVHMLRINTELGYVREGTLTEWQKKLS